MKTHVADRFEHIAAQIRAGDRRALARAITLVEEDGADAKGLLRQLYPDTGRAHLVGVTGPPGAGKSTLVNELAIELRRRERTVAIVAVDPSSPISGGAILGDRIRMQPLGGDPGIFMRSMATRGQLGGVARVTSGVVRVFDAAGFDVVLIETAGAGQAEVDIAYQAHTTIVVEVPGLGDDIQALKAGILEIADIFVVNKADRDGADRVKRQLKAMMQLAQLPEEGWHVPILPTVAIRAEGIVAVIDAVEHHLAFLHASGQFVLRERARVQRELDRNVQALALARLREQVLSEQRDSHVEAVLSRSVDPYTAAELLWGDVLGVVGHNSG